MKSQTRHHSILYRESLKTLMAHADILPLFEFSNVVNASNDLHFILDTVLRTFMGKFLISHGMILLRNAPSTFRIECVKGVRHANVGEEFRWKNIPTKSQVISLSKNANSSWKQLASRYRQSFLIPIISQNECIGILTFGKRNGTKKNFSSIEKRLMISLVNLSASAIEKAQIIEQLRVTNRSLDRKLQELNTLFDLSKEFNVGLDASRVLRLLSLTLMGQMGIQHYVICVNINDAPIVLETKGVEIDEEQFHSILNQLCNLEKPYTVEGLKQSNRYCAAATQIGEFGFTAVIPMRMQNRTMGIICLGENLWRNDYSQTDLDFLFALSSLATIAIENAHLLQEAIEKQQMEDELHIAREIQKGLFPAALPSIHSVELAAVNIQSQDVGGDYYDVVPINDDKFVFAIGDVAGKGMPASLLMANVQAALRTLAPICSSMSEMMNRINNVVCSNIHSAGKFITFFAGFYQPGTMQFTYSNAGHNPPFVIHQDGSITRLHEGGLILGVFPNTNYDERTLQVMSGDVLILYTDGISEAMNARSEEFTEERLEHIVRSASHQSAQEIVDAIQSKIAFHVQQVPQSDDITLLVLKVH
ncbi:MAG TPA: SpoIIE family protein phosphatase [Bacteroidota bacterium]|nr:SpoIIE family protein phosphatase [Bacteroidota bacterium]